MLKPENQVDKERFEDIKEEQQQQGQSEPEAIQEAAGEVKEMRQREGRSKDERS